MKRSGIITGIVLMLMVAGSGSLSAQRGMTRGMMDTTRMNRPGNRMEFMQSRGMGLRPDTMRMRGMMPGIGTGHMRHAMVPGQRMGMGGRMGRGNGIMRGMGHGPTYGIRGMGRGPAYGMRGMRNSPAYGKRGGMGRMLRDSVRQQMPTGLARYMMESMPNVTEKQKKSFSDLMLKQQEEMKKFSEETSSKMQSLMDSHRKNMMNLLTDEQKKFIESRPGNTNVAPAKGK